MNVLRSIYRSGRETEYPGRTQECTEYTKKHYSEVASGIRLKERAEYRMLQSAEPVYAWITRRLYKA